MKKKVSDISRTPIEVQEIEATRMAARGFISIAKNTKVFFFTFKLGFNRCIQKVKEFYLNIDSNFLTLTDLDVQSLIKEVMEGYPTSFVEVANAIEDDPVLGSLIDKGPSLLFAKPQRAPRSKKKKKINVYFSFFSYFLM